MKKFGLVMAIFFVVCTIGTQPVSAQAPGYGYLPLLSEGYDTSLPRQLVSRESFERLLPKLIEAKAMGIITDFEPDFYGGFVRVTNPTETLLKGSGALPVKQNMWDAIVRPTSPDNQDIQRAATLYYEIQNFSRCFYISGAGADVHIKGTITTSAGELLGVIDDYADSTGNMWDCFEGDGFAVPGHKITFKRFNPSTEVQLSSHTLIVPRITFKSFVTSDALVSGTATANLPYTARWYHLLLDANNTMTVNNLSGTVSADGKWSANFPGSFRGGDSIFLILNKGVFSVFHYFSIPYLYCRLRSNSCFLNTLPKKAVAMSIKHASVLYSFVGTTDSRGYFVINLETATGDPILLSSGDRITGTDAVPYNLPALTMSVNRVSNSISGKAPPNKFIEVSCWKIPYAFCGRAYPKSNATGDYNATFATDIPDTGFLETDIHYTDPVTGNGTGYYKYWQ